ncbi:MAG: hypothetical protein DCC58_01585, partial [Chloroflexi bacterium]
PASPGAATGVVATPTVADPDPTASGAPTGNPSDSTTATATEQPSPTDPATETPDTTPTETANPSPTASVAATPTQRQEPEGSVLPGSRVVSFYGHPNSEHMGILGEFDIDTVAGLLREQAAAFAAADPSRPVVPALELIATVAQPVPGDDGTYVAYTGDEIIGEFAEYTAANGMLLILDLQIGHSTIRDEIARISHWLELPHVHVALDPEFSTGPDRIPGEFIGEVDGAHVQIAVEYLSELVAEKNLPSKILIVHQFEEEMILNKSAIKPLPGVDIVIDMDGFGSPEAKVQNYHHFVRDELVEYGGIKLFYRQDDPLLTPEEIVALDPPPLVVIYQ